MTEKYCRLFSLQRGREMVRAIVARNEDCGICERWERKFGSKRFVYAVMTDGRSHCRNETFARKLLYSRHL